MLTTYDTISQTTINESARTPDEIVESLDEMYQIGGIDTLCKMWQSIQRLRPNTLTALDFWAMRRIYAKLFVNPQINLSPAATYLISLPYDDFTRFVQSDPAVLDSVMHADFRSPPPTGSGLLLRFDDLESLPLPAYAIDRYPIYEKGVNMLYGQPGIGKSFIALDFIGHVAARQPDKAIIYVAPEGWHAIPVRWRAWQKHYALSPANTFIMRDSLRLTDPNHVEKFREECERIGMPVHFIVFDTLARAMTGDNENDTREMSLFIEAVDRLRADLDCGVLFIHHINKQGVLRGSTVLEGALDSIIKGQRSESQIVLHNAQDRGGKNRNRAEAEPIYLNFVNVDVDSDQAVVVELGSKVVQTPTTDTLTGKQREILEALDGYDSGVSSRQLLDATNIPKATLYRHIKLLQQGGFLIHDREHERLTITKQGQDAYRA